MTAMQPLILNTHLLPLINKTSINLTRGSCPPFPCKFLWLPSIQYWGEGQKLTIFMVDIHGRVVWPPYATWHPIHVDGGEALEFIEGFH
jgi:hypothetical protein